MTSSVGGSARGPWAGPRGIGALAGFAPAAVILGWYLGTGGPLTPGLIVIAAACVSAGWLVGPRATGTARADIVATVGFFLIGYALETTAAIGLGILEQFWVGSATDLDAAVRDTASLLLARVLYLPVFGIFLSPAGLAWIAALRGLRAARRRSTT